jgi:hypothetical protein
MKQLFLLVFVLCMTFNCSNNSQISGAADDVNSGSLFGQLLSDGKKTSDTVSVSLFDEDTTASLTKQKAGKKNSLYTTMSFDGSYEFDSLPAGNYRVEVTKNSIVIGGERNIKLDRNEQKQVNITVVIIINQTFNIWTDNIQNVIINNFYIDNGKIEKTDGGYVLSSVPSDTIVFKVEITRNGKTEIVTIMVVRHDDGTSTFEIIDAPIDVVITPGTTPADGFLGILTIGIGSPGSMTVETVFDTGSVPNKSK